MNQSQFTLLSLDLTFQELLLSSTLIWNDINFDYILSIKWLFQFQISVQSILCSFKYNRNKKIKLKTKKFVNYVYAFEFGDMEQKLMVKGLNDHWIDKEDKLYFIKIIVKNCMLPQYPMQSYPQPVYNQLYNHQVSTFPQSYIAGSPAANLPYQYPGYLMQYPTTAMTGVAGYPAGYGPGFNGMIPINNGMYVTSAPGYASPKPSKSLRNSNVGIVQGAGSSPINRTMNMAQLNQYPLGSAIPVNLNTGQINEVRVGANPRVGSTTFHTVGAGIANQKAIQQMNMLQSTVALQGYSQIQYVPYESYYIDYEQRQFVQNVMVPVEKKVTDYYAVEHVVDYVPKEIEETVLEYIPEERLGNKLYYVPVETKLVHLPHHEQEHRTTATTQVHKTVTTQQNVIPHNTVQLPATVVGGQQRIISRPVQQVVPRQELIQGVTTTLPRGSGVRTPTVSPPKVQSTTNIVRPSIPPQSNVIQTGAPRTGIVSQPIPVQARTQVPPQTIPTQTVVNQARPPVVGGQNHFQQTQQYLQANISQFQQQMQIPDSAKVAYQYSTKTVRNLSPGEVPASKTGATTVGQPIPGPVTRVGQQGPVPVQGGMVQGQAPAMVRRTSGPGGQPQAIGGGFPMGPSSGPVGGGSQGARAPMQAPVQQQSNPTLMKNNKVDLADSEHIDITKSVFNATYGDSSQPQMLRQGSMTGTNAAIYTSGPGQSSNTFSFGQNTASLVQPYDSVANTNVNRSSGGFGGQVNNSKLSDAQANRISGGSVYDYDQLRDY